MAEVELTPWQTAEMSPSHDLTSPDSVTDMAQHFPLTWKRSMRYRGRTGVSRSMTTEVGRASEGPGPRKLLGIDDFPSSSE
jgi:hypothetical protein